MDSNVDISSELEICWGIVLTIYTCICTEQIGILYNVGTYIYLYICHHHVRLMEIFMHTNFQSWRKKKTQRKCDFNTRCLKNIGNINKITIFNFQTLQFEFERRLQLRCAYTFFLFLLASRSRVISYSKYMYHVLRLVNGCFKSNEIEQSTRT